MRDWTAIQRADRHGESLATAGLRFGAKSVFDWAEQVNLFGPELSAFDRCGMRINQVSYHNVVAITFYQTRR